MVKVDFLGLKGVFSPFKVAFLGLRNCFSLFEIGLLGLKGGFSLFKVRLLGLGRSLSLVGAFFVFRKLLQKIFHIDKMAGIFRVHLSYNRTGGAIWARNCKCFPKEVFISNRSFFWMESCTE